MKELATFLASLIVGAAAALIGYALGERNGMSGATGALIALSALALGVLIIAPGYENWSNHREWE